MKYFLNSLFLVAIVNCTSYTIIGPDKINVRYNPNIETYFILERLAVQRLGSYGYITKETDNSHQPMVKAAFDAFNSYQDSAIVIKTASLLDSLKIFNIYNNTIVEVLLYTKHFPDSGFLYPVKSLPYLDKDKSKIALSLINEYIEDMRDFYINADVNGFLNKNQTFYEGSIKEVKKDIPEKIGEIMEDYYGETVAQFTVIVNPTMPIAPVNGDFRGIGPTVQTENGKLPYMILSSSVMLDPSIQIMKRKHFGFDNQYLTRLLVVHEFGHSFINPHIESQMKTIDKFNHLFTSKLDSVMRTQDEGNWKTCVIEHLVRLGEIRIAETMNDKMLARKLRELHVHQEKHIFIPALEEKIKMYEEHRDRFPSFKSFIPELLTVFENFTPKEVDRLLGITDN